MSQKKKQSNKRSKRLNNERLDDKQTENLSIKTLQNITNKISFKWCRKNYIAIYQFDENDTITTVCANSSNMTEEKLKEEVMKKILSNKKIIEKEVNDILQSDNQGVGVAISAAVIGVGLLIAGGSIVWRTYFKDYGDFPCPTGWTKFDKGHRGGMYCYKNGYGNGIYDNFKFRCNLNPFLPRHRTSNVLYSDCRNVKCNTSKGWYPLTSWNNDNRSSVGWGCYQEGFGKGKYSTNPNYKNTCAEIARNSSGWNTNWTNMCQGSRGKGYTRCFLGGGNFGTLFTNPKQKHNWAECPMVLAGHQLY